MSLTPPVDPERDHILGPLDAPVTLVEYGDFECPYCNDAYPDVKRALARVGPQARFVFRQLPLFEKHPHAMLAAEASEAAGAQGRFWEMYDRLFEARRRLERGDIERYAEELGLDMPRFRADLDDHSFRERVLKQRQSALDSGAQGTPTFFIDGEPYSGFYNEETLADELLSRAERRA
jgi:protein-disulfide isomerase